MQAKTLNYHFDGFLNSIKIIESIAFLLHHPEEFVAL